MCLRQWERDDQPDKEIQSTVQACKFSIKFKKSNFGSDSWMHKHWNTLLNIAYRWQYACLHVTIGHICLQLDKYRHLMLPNLALLQVCYFVTLWSPFIIGLSYNCPHPSGSRHFTRTCMSLQKPLAARPCPTNTLQPVNDMHLLHAATTSITHGCHFFVSGHEHTFSASIYYVQYTFSLHALGLNCFNQKHGAYKFTSNIKLCIQLTLMVISRSVDLGMFRDTLMCAPEASCVYR